MRKKVGIVKRMSCLLLIFLLSINSFAAIVSDNDGSAFITKSEFDALKSSFQSQIDSYNQSIDSKIDGAIASYLAGIKLSSTEEITPQVPVNEKIISTTGNDYGWKEGNMKIDWQMITGPYGNTNEKYQLLHQTRLTNKQAASNFREIAAIFDATNKTCLYKSHDMNLQELIAINMHWAESGYSEASKENNLYFVFWGWRRINPEDDQGTPKNYGFCCRTNVNTGTGTASAHNRSISLSDGAVFGSNNWRSLGTVTMKRQKMSSEKLYIVCPNSVKKVWGVYAEDRCLGFCNDSSTDSLTDYGTTIGNHTIMTNDTQEFKFETVYSMYRKSSDQFFTVDSSWKIENGGGWGASAAITDWTTSLQPANCSSALTWTQSHNSNYGYYHKPYFGCENIKNWNKIGIDFGANTNTKILGVNNHGTLVNVNGSQYLSPVSGIPIFVATADGTAEVQIKFEKDADHTPDTNSTYADLYISNQPFKENDLGYNNAVIGPKSGSTARKLLSDQPAGHGTGSIKVDYGTVTNLKFEVQKDEPIFINFSAYEPSQSSYRGKCTATLQSNILLTKAN